MSAMTWWMSLGLGVACGLVGALVGQREGRAKSGLLWGLVLGPLGLVLFVVGSRKRQRNVDEPARWDPANMLNIGVEACFDGDWRVGTLQSWRQGEQVWEGFVRFPESGREPATGWFTAEQIRQVDAST